MFYTYILRSIDFEDKTYTGFTSDTTNRLFSHNHPGNKGWTKKIQPWELIYSEEFETKAEAMAREKYFKTGAGRRFIKETVLNK